MTGLGTVRDRGARGARAGAGRAVDRRADIWAFGVILYEMFTGRARFAGDSAGGLMAAVLEGRDGLQRAADS